jgi:hypothetical protein
VTELPDLPRQLKSTEVLIRFGLRMIVLTAFATFGGIGFDNSLVALLWMATALCAVTAAVRREHPFDRVLTHWDEATAYLALCCLVTGLNPAVPA